MFPTGTIFINLESGKLYKYVGDDNDSMRGSFVSLERIGDNRGYSINTRDFMRRYRPLSEEEQQVIENNRERINTLTRPTTIAELSVENKPEDSTVGKIVIPDERHDFLRIIVDDKIKDAIKIALERDKHKDFIYNTWNLKSIEPASGKCLLNFYGPPGTGKTLSALAIAKFLGKKVFQVDYSQIISKWVGDTGKHLCEAFKVAADNDCVLFFDEADSMLSRRVSVADGDNGSSTSINQNRNILMQEIDRFQGVVLFATNLFGNYDEALLRRISQHIEFTLPNEEMRFKLFQQHIPKEVFQDKDVNLSFIAKDSKGLSGGDIKNVCINAIISAALSNPQILKQDDLLKELDKVKNSKSKHKTKGFTKKPIGIGAELQPIKE